MFGCGDRGVIGVCGSVGCLAKEEHVGVGCRLSKSTMRSNQERARGNVCGVFRWSAQKGGSGEEKGRPDVPGPPSKPA